MRCLACDHSLTDFEATRKFSEGNEFVDLCSGCLAVVSDVLLTQEIYDLYDPEGGDFLDTGSAILTDIPEGEVGNIHVADGGGYIVNRGYGPDDDEM